MTLRLQVFLSRNGVCSRRDAMALVQSGRVTVNGQTVKEPSYAIDPSKDRVTVGGKPVDVKQFVYILLNKPAGYTTTKSDPHAEKTVLDLLPKEYHHLNPVGRLDRDTEGLLILTNDGDAANTLTHPRFKVNKKYRVKIDGVLNSQARRRLQQGVMLEGLPTAPAKIDPAGGSSQAATDFYITIHEGRKRQIRRMLEQVGRKVTYLQRVLQGPFKLENIPVGQWRKFSPDELKALTQLKKKCALFEKQLDEGILPQPEKVRPPKSFSKPAERPTVRPKRSPRRPN